ncbi:MAG: hypothetical protein LQ339_005648 [Xanthoria mediterranea]|nr:MAG: hypothetical protein LQ339_005648 [Xanthoria mediterranea]
MDQDEGRRSPSPPALLRFVSTEQSNPRRRKSQPSGATDTDPICGSTSRAIKQEPNTSQSLMAREQLLRQAAKASFGLTLGRRRSDTPALNTQQPPAQYHKQPTPPPTLPLGPTARLNLHDVEMILASLNRQINNTSEMDAIGLERLVHEKDRVVGSVYPANSTDRYVPAPLKAKNCAHLANTTDRYTPAPSDPLADARANTNDRSGRMGSWDRSIDRYVPIDRYTPRPKSQGTTAMAKRRREPSPADEMELIAEVITQVARITKRVSGLHDLPGPQKMEERGCGGSCGGAAGKCGGTHG